MLNKKADTGDMMMILAFLTIILIIGIGIPAGAYLYYKRSYDFRGIDSELLNQNLVSCLSQNNFDFSLSQESLEPVLFTTCALNEKVIKENFIILIEKHNAPVFSWKGDKTACALADKNKNFPVCTVSQLKDLTILTGSIQKSRTGLT